MDLRIGTAGWSVPRASASRFDSGGTHLERYARQMRCVEINSCFYRPHRAATYSRWRDSTPPDFRFAVKMPRVLTHDRKLHDVREPLAEFLAQTEGLGDKRGPILVQLPPSFAFDPAVVPEFLANLRTLYPGLVVCEPRHATWFSPEVDALFKSFEVSRVAADPPPVPGADVPAGWPRIAYFRLHGSPRKYWSKYETPYLDELATTIRGLPDAETVWCIFDNTGGGTALENAFELKERLS